MIEIPNTNIENGPEPDFLTLTESDSIVNPELPGEYETVGDLRAAQEAWLKRRGIEEAPHSTMTRREFELLREMGLGVDDVSTSSLTHKARRSYGISPEARYAWVDVASGNTDPKPELVAIGEEDFGTVIDAQVIAKDFDESIPPGSAPEVATVDISDVLIESRYDLQELATAVMEGITKNPFYDGYNDIGIRAGGLSAGQEDAYVWTKSPLSSSIELTIAFPSQYDSVCIVSGQQRDPRNGKAGMAQIDNPVEVMRIEGDALKQTQDVYHRLYNQPDFVLTEAQKTERDALFNDH